MNPQGTMGGDGMKMKCCYFGPPCASSLFLLTTIVLLCTACETTGHNVIVVNATDLPVYCVFNIDDWPEPPGTFVPQQGRLKPSESVRYKTMTDSSVLRIEVLCHESGEKCLTFILGPPSDDESASKIVIESTCCQHDGG